MVKYESAFSAYKAYQEQQPVPWKQAMEEVAREPGAAHHYGMRGMDHRPSGVEETSKQDMTSVQRHEPIPRSSGAKHRSVDSAAKGGHGHRHEAMAMAKPESSASVSKTTERPAGPVSGTGVIQQIDKANGKVRMTHEPIDALGWPKLTMFFRLKDSALADRVKEGEKVRFSLEKSPSGYVITRFQKP
jgi:Cu/Ag efflux protein CusF